MEKHSRSQEDYLETILLLKFKKGVVRSIDIAEEMNYSKPSISRAVSLLKESGYITMDADNRTIELTPTGREKARQVYKKHCILRAFLAQIGATGDEAEQGACEMEHILSEDTCDKINAFLRQNGTAAQV